MLQSTWALVKRKAAFFVRIIGDARNIEEVCLLAKYFAPMQNAWRNSNANLKNVGAVFGRLAHLEYQLLFECRALRAIIKKDGLNFSDGNIPPVVLNMMIVPGLDDVLGHLAVAPLRENAVLKERVC